MGLLSAWQAAMRSLLVVWALFLSRITAAATRSLLASESPPSMHLMAHLCGVGTGQLNFVGGAGPSALIGGSGNSTVFGGAGMTSLFGGAGGAATYVNTTSGGLEYVGGSGSETLDASLSKGVGELYGANDPAGHDLLIAGQNAQFLTAGTGSDTLVGGGGENGFFFWSGYDGGRNDVISNFSAIDYVYWEGMALEGPPPPLRERRQPAVRQRLHCPTTPRLRSSASQVPLP